MLDAANTVLRWMLRRGMVSLAQASRVRDQPSVLAVIWRRTLAALCRLLHRACPTSKAGGQAATSSSAVVVIFSPPMVLCVVVSAVVIDRGPLRF